MSCELNVVFVKMFFISIKDEYHFSKASNWKMIERIGHWTHCDHIRLLFCDTEHPLVLVLQFFGEDPKDIATRKFSFVCSNLRSLSFPLSENEQLYRKSSFND